ncbi:MAG: ATP-binding protein [Desulfuromonadales bacterium]
MKKLTTESKIVSGFVAALVLMLLAGWQMYSSLMDYSATSRLVAHTHMVLEAVEEVRFGMNALVSSQRTYIITGKELYLAENKREEARVRSVAARIGQLIADNPRQQLRSDELSRLLEERLKLMNANIILYRDKGFEMARERIINGTADVSMDALEKMCDAMREEELTLLNQRSIMVESNAAKSLKVGALLVAVTLSGLPFLWWRVRRSTREREESNSMVQESRLLKQFSDDLLREDTINKAYGDILTLINQDWFSVQDMTQAALLQFNNHVSIMAGVSYIVQVNGLTPVSSLGIPLPGASGAMAQEALKRNELVRLRDIPADSMLGISTGVGSVIPHEIIAVPLSIQNEIVAVVELASLHGFEETDMRIINRIAPQLGFGIKQRRLEQDVKDRSSQLECSNFELQTINDESEVLNESLQLLNEELKTQQEVVTESNRRLEEVSRSKSDFLANMSHELRTPLNSVIGFSEVLQDRLFGPLNEKQLEYVNNILISGRHLLSLINDILDLSKVESGKMELELSEFSLREAMENSLMMLREKAMKGGVALTMELAPSADITITADQRKLKQILFNLCSNAVKFTLETGTVHVSALKDGDFIEITVADSGLGIREEDIQKLFQAFTQLESVYTKEFEGTGLGLALTRQLVELHGGRVWVKSVYGEGSRFSFTIPLKIAVTRESPAIPAGSFCADHGTVLLIEDNPLSLSSMENALQSKGYRVLKALKGEEGIRKALSGAPDIVVLDLMMPGMNGFDVADRLLSEEAVAHVPILVLTAMDLSESDRLRLKGKVWRIAEKGSLSTHEFIALVESAIRKR